MIDRARQLATVALTSGQIEYTDTGGDGPVVVFGHGVPMNGQQWRKVLPLLPGYRCVLPTLPLGAHRIPMHRDADLSQRGVALVLGEFLDALDLEDVTLVLNDWGGGQFLVSEGRAQRVGRLVLIACEAFDNFPPRPARLLASACHVPGVVWLIARLMAIPAVRHHPRGQGGMSLQGVPDGILDEWFSPMRTSRGIRRDFAKFATSTPDRRTLLAWSRRLRNFDRPVLVMWAEDDPLMPAAHGELLADLFPMASLVRVADSSTLIPEDQPEVVAAALTEFLAANRGDLEMPGES